jgi:thymidylate synthase (FAD)
MKLINPSYEILTDLNQTDLLNMIEVAGRTCYKSEDRITPESGGLFAHNLITRGHEAMLEFGDIMVRFIHNRGFTHELVRHRLCSFAQESTRYCNYSKDKFGNEITFIMPYWFYEVDADIQQDYIKCLGISEAMYLKMIENKMAPQAARGILPNDLKTEIVIKANVREWRNILYLRTSPAAHPDMIRVMKPLLDEFRTKIPVLFEDVGM